MTAQFGFRHRACVALLATLASPLHADVIALRNGVNGYDGTRDTTVFENSTTGAAGGTDAFFCGRNGFDGGRIALRGLLAFDAAPIPAGSTVTRVTLTLMLERGGFAGTVDEIVLHRMTNDWGEGSTVTLGGNPGRGSTGDATWTHNFLSQSSWATPGGDFVGDVVSTLLVINTTPGMKTFPSTPDLVADVQRWIDDPGSNFGWIVIGNEADIGSARRFVSSESNAVANRPQLTVEFLPPAIRSYDFDGDDDVDLSDFLALVSCYSGPGVAAPSGCEAGDADDDDDVDLSDVVGFQQAFTGSR